MTLLSSYINTAQAHGNNVALGHHMYSGIGYSSVSWFFMFLFLILTVVAIVFLVKYFAQEQNKTTTNSNAIEILKERYVKGEIDKEEFEQKKKDIL